MGDLCRQLIWNWEINPGTPDLRSAT